MDWDHKVVTCPAGKQSISRLPSTYPPNGMTWEVRFARRDCTACPLRPRCTKAKREPRLIGLQDREVLRRCKLPVNGTRHRSFDSGMRRGLASKQHTSKPFGAAGCATHATSARSRPTFSMS